MSKSRTLIREISGIPAKTARTDASNLAQAAVRFAPVRTLQNVANDMRRFVIEVGTAPTRITLREFETGSMLAVLGEQALNQLAPPPGRWDKDAFDFLERLLSLGGSPDRIGANLP